MNRRPGNAAHEVQVATRGALAVLQALQSHLESRAGALFSEVRHYPTPIARCDDQLPKLLEQRAHVMGRLREVREAGGLADSQRDETLLAGLRKLVRHYPRGDDDLEMDLLARLAAALQESGRPAPREHRGADKQPRLGV